MGISETARTNFAETNTEDARDNKNPSMLLNLPIIKVQPLGYVFIHFVQGSKVTNCHRVDTISNKAKCESIDL